MGTPNNQNNFDRFPFIFEDDDSEFLGQYWRDPEASSVDSKFDGPRDFTAADLDALAYGFALQGLI